MDPMDIPLKGRIILVTGGASDLRTTPAFDELAASNSNIHYVFSDVTRWADLQNLFTICEEKWNDVPDAYGICAGVFEPSFSNFWHDPEQGEGEGGEGGYKQVRVNVDHPVKLTRLVIKKSLGRRKRASVCIISSIAGIAGNVAAPLYCATKHAIVGFVKSLASSEAFTGVKITTICPGLVATPIFDAQKIQQFSFKNEGALSPDEVAENMLKLLQEKKYGCGTVLEISKLGTRVIPEWNVEPPTGEGTGQDLEQEKKMMESLLGPILGQLKNEKRDAKL